MGCPMEAATLLRNALSLAEDRIPVFPCDRDKRPLTPHGFLDATTDPTTLRAMFALPGAALVAVPTGEPSGIVVLDGDLKASSDGRATLRQWTQEGQLPRTRVCQTRRGGVHLFFRHNPARPVRCSQSKLAPQVDVRGDGGYVVWWAASGGAVLVDLPLSELPDLPDWVAEALEPSPIARREPPRCIPKVSGHNGPERRLEAVIRAAALAPDGSRNGTLYWASRRCAEMVTEGALAPGAAHAVLVEAARHAGLSEREAAATVASGLRWGDTYGR